MPAGTDRYNAPLDPGAQMEERFRRIEQQLNALQGRNPLNNAVFSGTTRNVDESANVVGTWGPDGFQVFDATGLLRARFGYIDATAGYGVSIFDDAGGLRFEVNDNGYRDPWLAHPWRKVITPERESTTSATFVSLWRSRVEIITHGGVATTAAWVTDPGTTAEIRLKIGSVNTSAVALAAGASGVQQFQWLHGQPLGSGPADFELQARVTGGAGEVHLDAPMSGLEMADPLQCDADGLP